MSQSIVSMMDSRSSEMSPRFWFFIMFAMNQDMLVTAYWYSSKGITL